MPPLAKYSLGTAHTVISKSKRRKARRANAHAHARSDQQVGRVPVGRKIGAPVYGTYSTYKSPGRFIAKRRAFFRALPALPSYVWRISHRLWNKAIHALIGNASGESIIRKLFTQGMPILKEGSLSPQDFLSFRIDLEGWAGAQGITPLIVGPLPTAPAADPARPDIRQNYDDRVAQGMRYVCHAVQDTNLRASMASQSASQSGPACIEWLSKEILQSQAEQPALQHIIDSMTLKPSESIIGFKAIFCKFNHALQPQPAPETSCSKFITAVTKDTAGFFEDCVTAAISSTDQTDFASFASKLILLCSNKSERSNASVSSESAMQIELQALKAEILALQYNQKTNNDGGPRRDINDGGPRRERDTRFGAPRDCSNCGGKHPTKECTKPRAKCPFEFGDGTTCGGPHLLRYCFFKDPSKVRDPKMRSAIERKLVSRGSAQNGNHANRGDYDEGDSADEFYFATVHECNDDEAGGDDPLAAMSVEIIEDTPPGAMDPMNLPDDIIVNILLPLLDDATAVSLSSTNSLNRSTCASLNAARIVDADEASQKRGYASLTAEKAFRNAVLAQKREVAAHTSLTATTAYGLEQSAPYGLEQSAEKCMAHTVTIAEAHGSSDATAKPFLYVDTGASDHIINDARCIIDPSLHRPVNIRIRTGNGISHAKSRGPATFNVTDRDGNVVSITRDVIFCPTFHVNLYSPSKDWKDFKASVLFDDTCTITLKEGVIPFIEERGSYKLHYAPPAEQAMSSSETVVFPRPTDDISLWHRRTGHTPFSALRHLPNHAVGPDFMLSKSDALLRQENCIICQHARMKAASHPNNRVVRTPGMRTPLTGPHVNFGDCVFMDLAGPLPVMSFHSASRYISIFVDGATSHIGLYLLRLKSDQIEAHKRYCADNSRYGALDIKHFHSDNGGEYTSQDYCDLIMENGALKTTIVAKSPAMNTNAEAAFFRIFSTIRALLIDSGLPKSHWGAAAQFAAYILNRTSRANGQPTVYERLDGRSANLKHIRIFGCLASALKPRFDRTSKIHDVAVTGFYVGPSRYQRGALIWVPGQGRYVVARTVHFNERVLYRDHFAIPGALKDAAAQPDDDDSDDDDGFALNKLAPAAAAAPPIAARPVLGADRVTRSHGTPHATQYDPRTHAPVNYFPPAQRFADAQGNLSAMPTGQWATDASPTGESYPVATSIDEEQTTYSTDQMGFEALIHDDQQHVQSTKEPANYFQAMRGPDSKHWEQAMKEELASHEKNGTWEPLSASQIPSGTKVVGCTWVFKLKRNADGTIARYKARLCAQGFSQVEGLHYEHTYSNTITRDTFRILLAMAARFGLKLSGADVKTAYLYALIDEGLFLVMKLPPGFEKIGPDGNPMVGRLRRSIYGLKQSAARWEARLSKHLLQYGFTRCEIDPCMYKLEKNEARLFMAVYVDDLIFASSHDSLREHVLADLRKEFEITDTGPLTWVLGSNVEQNLNKGTVSLCQKLYIEDMVAIILPDASDQVEKGSRVNPASDDLIKLVPGDTGNPDQLYRKGVGMLAWLVAISRPDMAYTQSMLARYSGCGGEAHLKCLIHAVKYLARTKNYSITYRKFGSDALIHNIQSHSKFRPEVLDADDVISFTDASSGGEKPMAGEVHYFAGAPIGWRAGRLSDTPLGSAEAEYVAASRAATTTVCLRAIVPFFTNETRTIRPTVLFCDNIAAVMLSDSNITSKRMKHVMTRLAYLRERVEAKDIYLYHIGTKGQIADIMTKTLPTSTFHEMRALMLS